jgi:hypothetical protein
MQVAEVLEMATVRSFKSEALTGAARAHPSPGLSVEERMTIARLRAFKTSMIDDESAVIIITEMFRCFGM